ncbi:SixA phosphatase family protein [Aliikangiella sp. IMCC44359]|uniref:SixA phosphatase family protein n=1 Tax=Aliikangiella sp. IMCC44359 TaxID=3459125 RepID=UPI00403A7DF6
MKYLIITIGLLLLCSTVNAEDTLKDQTVTIYLVRHAEKQTDDTKNPSLTQQGQQRAKKLAQTLKLKNIKRIFSTQYKRTIQTALPLAKQLKIDIEFYDPGKLLLFANEITTLKENILIVGHSNTTPVLVELLGGKPFGKIKENEYDRLYVLEKYHGEVESKLLKTNHQ